MSEVYGAKVEAQRRLTFLSLGQFTANSAVIPAPRFGCPPGVAGVRIIGLHIACSAVPSDADGVLTVNADVNDVSEGGTDVIVSAQDLETLVTAANRWYEMTLAAETAEKQLTLEPGDALSFDLTSNSVAIDSNPQVNICVEWHPIPDHEDLARIGHPSDYDGS